MCSGVGVGGKTVTVKRGGGRGGRGGGVTQTDR